VVEVVEAGVVADGVAEPRHGLVVAGDGIVARNAGRKIGGGVMLVNGGASPSSADLSAGLGPPLSTRRT
jgi:hypothetical protein